MTFLGKVLQIDEREHYFKIAAAVETGYNTDIYFLRIPNDKMIDDLAVGHKILFTGHRQKRDDVEKFCLESVKRQDYSSCMECGFPLTSFTCLIRHDKEAQKFQGEWTIVHKMISPPYIKMFFLQGSNFVFAAVSQPKRWIHEKFQQLEEGDKVRVEGWRYKQRTSLGFIEKLNQ
ncbi:MAG: hypothetical protein GY782_00460 [Gammaproteobacteria bacterium]|nr:hypothetical protein [Gammaproteobacteria bacterium]